MEYDNAVGGDVLYHYAAEEGESKTEHDYIETIEYEEPLEPGEFKYATTEREISPVKPDNAPALPEKKPSVIIQRKTSRIGLIGLLGLAGLLGFIQQPKETKNFITSSNSAADSTSTTISDSTIMPRHPCRVGEVIWSIGPIFDGFMVANGSAFDSEEYPDLAKILPLLQLPLLIDRYPRGTTVENANTFYSAEINTDNIQIKVEDPGHGHSGPDPSYSVLRDGSHTLAHLYSFNSDGMNLKTPGHIISQSKTGIKVTLDNPGNETRPASLGLVPLICSGNKINV